MVETSYGEKHGKAVRSVFTDTDGSGHMYARIPLNAMHQLHVAVPPQEPLFTL